MGTIAAPLALVGGQVFLRGSRAPGTLVLAGGRVTDCGPDVVVPEGARTIDVSGRTILPGLIDAHAHLSLGDVGAPEARLALDAAARAAAHLRAGVTTVRDVGGMRHVDIALRNAVAAGRLPGPTMQCAGEPIVMTGGHGHAMYRVADGPTAVRTAVREQVARGADLIKVMCSGGVMEAGESEALSQFTEEELAAIIGEARAQHRPVAAHAHPAEAIKRAVRLGASSIEHGSFVDDEAADLMADRGVPLVPTFVVYREIADHAGHPAVGERARRVYQAKFAHFARAVERGMPWGVGSDYSSLFFSTGAALVAEMQILQDEVGFSPAEVIAAATVGNAGILGLGGTVGELVPGQRADVVVVDGDPLRCVSALHDVVLTIAGGTVHDWSTDAHLSGPSRAEFR